MEKYIQFNESMNNFSLELINNNDTLLSDNDTTDPLHRVASVLSSKKRKLGQSSSNFNNFNRPEAFPISKFSESTDRKSNLRTRSKHSEQKIDQNDLEDWISTNSKISENKDLVPRINSIHSSKLSSGLLYQHEMDEQNDQLNNMDTKNRNEVVLPAKHIQSHMIGAQEDRQTDNNINNPFNQLRSKYDDM